MKKTAFILAFSIAWIIAALHTSDALNRQLFACVAIITSTWGFSQGSKPNNNLNYE